MLAAPGLSGTPHPSQNSPLDGRGVVMNKDYAMIRDADTDREFVLAWEAAAGVQEVADRLGVGLTTVRRREWELRAEGVPLRWLGRDAKGQG